jgi:hypothetical protein
MSPKKPKLQLGTERTQDQSDGPENELDTRGLLEKMRQTVEGMTRRMPITSSNIVPSRERSLAREDADSLPETSDKPRTTLTPVKRNAPTPMDDTPMADDEASPDVAHGERRDEDESEEDDVPEVRPRRVLRGNAGRKPVKLPPSIADRKPDVSAYFQVAGEQPDTKRPTRRTANRSNPEVTMGATSSDSGRNSGSSIQESEDDALVPTRRSRVRNATAALSKSPIPESEVIRVTPEPEMKKKTRSARSATKTRSKVEEPLASRPKKSVKDQGEKSDTSSAKQATTDKENTIEAGPKNTRRKKTTAPLKEEVMTEPELRPKRVTRARTRTQD